MEKWRVIVNVGKWTRAAWLVDSWWLFSLKFSESPQWCWVLPTWLTATWVRLATRRPLGTACGVHWVLPESFTTSLRPLCCGQKRDCPITCGDSCCGWPVGILEGWSCVTWNDLGLRWRSLRQLWWQMGDMLLTQLSVAILLPSLCLREAAVWRQNQTALATVPKRHLQKCQLHGSQGYAVLKKEI